MLKSSPTSCAFLNCTPDLNMILDCYIFMKRNSTIYVSIYKFISRSYLYEIKRMRRVKTRAMDKANH